MTHLRFFIAGLCAVCIVSSCSSSRPVLVDDNTFLLQVISTDASYGYTQNNPVKVGGSADREGPKNEQRFLNALAGPHGEPIRYNRLGSCCAFETANGILGHGLLDKYEIVWAGQSEPVILYINMYDSGELQTPVGMTIKR